jgi:hypothetical protein
VLPAALLLWALPGQAPATVNPVTLIQRQVIKPNMLLVLDTSTSMEFAPGDRDLNAAEVGMDCDGGDVQCRKVGLPGRCFYAGTGAMGAGAPRDYTSCHNDAECRTGWCVSDTPNDCSRDSDCSSGYCKGYCTNDNTRACTRDSGCTSGATCRGICANTVASSTACTLDSQCGSSNDYCSVFPGDVCITSGAQAVAKTCAYGGNRCRSDSDCTANAGDTCVGATSRLVIAKRVLSNIVSTYYTKVNFGLMTFYQKNYFPYYKVSGTVTYTTLSRFLGKDQLAALGCWTKTAGPSATCTVDSQVYTLRASNNSAYRVITGGSTYSDVDASWCGSLWCAVTGGTGYYRGSYFTYQDPNAALASTTPSIQATYGGPVITISGNKYVYWNPPPEMRNGGNIFLDSPGPEPISAGDGDTTLPCTDQMGGRADTVVAPFMDTTDDPVKAQNLITQLTLKLDKAHLGGLAAEGFTPTGCTLAYDNTTYATTANNALSYMKAVKAADSLSCRNNYVLLVTDGWPTRAYDDNCDDARCSAADPTAAGCPCWVVKAAQKLKTNGIKTYVVGFGQATANVYATTTLNNIARAGGATGAMFANNENGLYDSMVSAIYDAAQGSYSTSPASASSGTQTSTSVSLGTMLLDTRVDFPGWKGQVIAYETSSGSPVVSWSANTVAFNAATDANFWKKRNVWTSNGTTMVKIDVNSSTGAITNAAALATLGLGTDATEATRVARWMLGDPAMKNPAVLGAVINSTPIDVAGPGNSPLPGGAEFFASYSTRPALTYVGSSDGMLHAFFTKSVTIGSTTYPAGQEAFAYIPQTMLAVALKLYAQGGQLPDPKDHIYGLANSAKTKNLCTANCDGTSGTPTWKTVLAMAYGFGGTEAFVLDITNPFSTTGVKSSTTTPPVSLLWNTQYLSPSTTAAYDNDLGLTTSVPAFYYAKGATKDDFRMIFGSYASTVGSGVMGKVLLNASVKDGSMLDADTIVPPVTGCTQSFGLLTDVGTARNFAAAEEDQILAAYFGDTWGNLYRYVPAVSGTSNYTTSVGTVTTVQSFGCTYPVHYMPAIVQLDRDSSANRAGEIYLVQVTNSALDDETKSFPASKMVVRRDIGTSSGSSVGNDATWTPITLTAGTTLCGVTNASGTCTTTLPATARPNATPLAVLRQDGLGFDVLSTWYLPPTDGCTDGVTYLNIYQINVNGTYALKYATQLASEPITSTVFVGGKLMFASQTGVTDLTPLLPSSLSFGAGTSATTSGTPDRFRRLGWSEIP